VETGSILDRDRRSSFVDVLPVVKGVIWLLLATFAEVTPVVSPAGLLLLFFCSSRYVTGIYFVGSER
jgi:hypothetical protein